MKLLKSIKSLFKSIKNLSKKRSFGKVQIIDNNSSIKPQKNTITVVRKNSNFSWVKFYCPCGCGREVTLSLNSNIQPYWNIRIKNDKVTLSPSVYLTGFQCKSHFFIRNNKIDWV